MRAAVCPGVDQPLQIREMDVPSPRAGEVLIRVHACGVCHTDVFLAAGKVPAAKFPRVLGHEVAGEIVEVGDNVSRSMIGRRVGMPWTYSTCGCCNYCLAGDEVLCPDAEATGVSQNGGYADYMVAPAAFTTPLPDTLSYAEAAPLFCAGLTAYKALKVGGIQPGKKVAVQGIGGLGHLAIQFARYMGADVIAVTGTEEKEHLARELGAHYTVNTREKDLVRECDYLGGADLILSTLWDPREVERAIQCLAPDGTLVMLGVPKGPVMLPAQFLLAGRRRIVASMTGSRHDLREMLNFSALHNVHALIEKFPLEEANRSHERVRENKPRFRDVLVMAE